jgi:hypothetical protein
MNGNVWYMLLSFNTSADSTIRVSFMKTAPTGGTTTASPTSVDQWWSNTTTPLTAADWIINAAATDNSRFNLGLTSEGGFYFLGCKQASSLANLVVIFAPLSNRKSGDLYPVWTFVQYLATGVMRQAGSPNEPYSRTAGAAGGHGCKHPVTAGAVTNGPIFVWYDSQGSVFAPAAIDGADGTYPDIPWWVGFAASTATGAPTSIRGRVADFAGSPNTIATMPETSVSPTSGAIDSCRVGQTWFPANATFNFT